MGSGQVCDGVVAYGPEKKASERSLGLVFAAFFSLVTIWRWYHDQSVWLVVLIALTFAVVAWLRPAWLAPLNHVWHRLGLALFVVVNPVVMAVIFYGAVMPTALVMRWRGKDLLQRTMDPEASSYWIKRTPPGPEGRAMEQQF